MDVAWLMLNRKGMRVSCSCGHEAQFDGLDIALSVGETTPIADVGRRLRCSACCKRGVSWRVTETPDGSPLKMSDIIGNLWKRCQSDPCYHELWLTQDEARAFGDLTLEEYRRSLACPACGRVGKFAVRATSDPIPTVSPMMGSRARSRR